MDWLSRVPDCPVYSPSEEEFRDPMGYIRKIQTEAEPHGICKIVPPYSFFAHLAPPAKVLRELQFRFTTRVQHIRMPSRARGSPEQPSFFLNPKKYSITDFEFEALKAARKQLASGAMLPPAAAEAHFWRELSAGRLEVEYGSDVEGSAFSEAPDDRMAQSAWNLNVLPRLEGSVLRQLTASIPGVTEPMLYIGMLNSMFAWHVEDHFLLSINYHHMGAPKIWYGVPGQAALAFEAVARKRVYSPALVRKEGVAGVCRSLIGKTTMFPPLYLLEEGVPVTRAVQNAGEFVVTFPRSYHGGFSTGALLYVLYRSSGFNCGEAVNFGTPEWFPFSSAAARRYALLQHTPLLNHEELLCKEAEALWAGVQAASPAAPARASTESVDLATLTGPAQLCSAHSAVVVVLEFLRLVKFLHRMSWWMVHQQGARRVPLPPLSGSMYCSLCQRLCWLATTVCCCQAEPVCLHHDSVIRECKCGPVRQVSESGQMLEMVRLALALEASVPTPVLQSMSLVGAVEDIEGRMSHDLLDEGHQAWAAWPGMDQYSWHEHARSLEPTAALQPRELPLPVGSTKRASGVVNHASAHPSPAADWSSPASRAATRSEASKCADKWNRSTRPLTGGVVLALACPRPLPQGFGEGCPRPLPQGFGDGAGAKGERKEVEAEGEAPQRTGLQALLVEQLVAPAAELAQPESHALQPAEEKELQPAEEKEAAEDGSLLLSTVSLEKGSEHEGEPLQPLETAHPPLAQQESPRTLLEPEALQCGPASGGTNALASASEGSTGLSSRAADLQSVEPDCRSPSEDHHGAWQGPGLLGMEEEAEEQGVVWQVRKRRRTLVPRPAHGPDAQPIALPEANAGRAGSCRADRWTWLPPPPQLESWGSVKPEAGLLRGKLLAAGRAEADGSLSSAALQVLLQMSSVRAAQTKRAPSPLVSALDAVATTATELGKSDPAAEVKRGTELLEDIGGGSFAERPGLAEESGAGECDGVDVLPTSTPAGYSGGLRHAAHAPQDLQNEAANAELEEERGVTVGSACAEPEASSGTMGALPSVDLAHSEKHRPLSGSLSPDGQVHDAAKDAEAAAVCSHRGTAVLLALTAARLPNTAASRPDWSGAPAVRGQRQPSGSPGSPEREGSLDELLGDAQWPAPEVQGRGMPVPGQLEGTMTAQQIPTLEPARRHLRRARPAPSSLREEDNEEESAGQDQSQSSVDGAYDLGDLVSGPLLEEGAEGRHTGGSPLWGPVPKRTRWRRTGTEARSHTCSASMPGLVEPREDGSDFLSSPIPCVLWGQPSSATAGAGMGVCTAVPPSTPCNAEAAGGWAGSTPGPPEDPTPGPVSPQSDGLGVANNHEVLGQTALMQ